MVLIPMNFSSLFVVSILLGGGSSAQCLIESIEPADGSIGNEFGIRMASFGNTLLVGAFRDDEGELDAGAVYAYHRDDNQTPFDPLDDSWIEITKIMADVPVRHDLFGGRVAIHEDLAVISAREKVHFFVREDNGTPTDPLDDSWIQVFLARPTQPTVEFGVGLGVWRDTVVIGTENNLAWIYERLDNGTPSNPFDDGWVVTKTLNKQSAGGRFAWSLAIYEDTILFGARRADVAGVVDAGAAYVYDRDDAGTPGNYLDDDWIETAFITTQTLIRGASFGREVALDGDTALLGAWTALLFSPPPTNTGTGLAYIFERDRMGTPGDPADDVWVETAILAPSDGAEDDRFGVGVSLEPDVAVVGAHFHDLGPVSNAGAAYVYERKRNGTPHDRLDDSWPETAKLVDPRALAEDHFGIWPNVDGRTVFAGSPSLPGLNAGVVHAFDIVCPDVLLEFETEDDLISTLVNGQDVTPAGEFGRLVSIDGNSAMGLSAAVFDSSPSGFNAALGQDPDLIVDRGNVLILQENPLQTWPGIYDIPDDDRFGGSFLFDFLGQEVTPVSVDLIDVDLISNQDVTVTLYDGFGRRRTYMAPGGWTEDIAVNGPPGQRRLDLQTLADQPGFLATATASEDAGFVPTAVDRIEIRFEGSAALDNLRFRPASALAPELWARTFGTILTSTRQKAPRR